MAGHIGEVCTCGRAELEAFEELEVKGQVGDDLVSVVLSAGLGKLCKRVCLLVVDGAVGNGVGAALLVADNIRVSGGVHGLVGGLGGLIGKNGLGRCHSKGGAKRGTVLGVGADAGGVDVGVGKGCAEVGLVQEGAVCSVVEELDTNVLMIGETLVVGPVVASADGSLTVKVTGRDAVVHILRTAAHVEVVLDHGSVLVEDGFYPVGSHAQ